MLVARLLQVVRRRWLIVTIGVLATGALAAAVPSVQPPSHSVSATALLLPPRTTADGTEANPYLQLGGLTTAVDVLARALNDPQVHDQIVTSGADDYSAQRDFLTAAPLLVVEAQAPTAQRAAEIRDEVLAGAPEVLSELQATVGVPTKSRITMETIVTAGESQLEYKSVLRTMILVLVGGLALTVLVAGGIDGWLVRRRESRAAGLRDGTVG